MNPTATATASARATAPRASLAVILATSVGAGIAHLGTSTMPFLVGALMDGAHYSASAAGLFGFFLVGSLALSMIVAAPLMHRIRPRALAVTGLMLGGCAHAAIYWLIPGTVVMCMLAIAAGTGYGFLFASVVVASAGYANADRLYAIANGGAVAYIVAAMATFPIATRMFGSFGPFLLVALLLVVALPAAVPLRASATLPDAGVNPAGFAWRPEVIALLCAWTAFSLGTGASWAFAERVGHQLQIAPGAIGFILSTSTLFGVAGTSLSALLAGRVPRVLALTVGMAMAGLSCAAIGNAIGPVTYALAVAGYWLSYMFVYPAMLGAGAAMDPSGKVGTMGGGCERMGYAVGAPLGGLIVQHASFAVLGWVGAAACVIVIPFTMPLIGTRLRGGLPSSA